MRQWSVPAAARTLHAPPAEFANSIPGRGV